MDNKRDYFCRAPHAARYAKSEGLGEAYVVVFTEVHPRDTLTGFFDENLDGIALKGVIVNVNFEKQ